MCLCIYFGSRREQDTSGGGPVVDHTIVSRLLLDTGAESGRGQSEFPNSLSAVNSIT